MIDSHCHLADDAFAADLQAVVDRAAEAGLTGAMCILSAGDEAELSAAGRILAAWTAVRFSTGIHPHNAGTFAGRTEEVRGALAESIERVGAKAIGEIGLDYHYDFSPREVQRDVFAAQVDVARERSLPIVIHTREATADTFAILREAGPGVRGVFHCFTGDRAMAAAALDLGFYISLAGIVTFPKAAELREVAKAVPIDRLLVETDSPYLAPVPHRGKRNEPAFVARTVDAIAAVRGVPAADLARQTAGNFAAFLGPTVSLQTA
jgi:TatD DNase family protein